MRAITVAAALLMSGFAVASAQAAPAAKITGVNTAAPVIDVQYRDHGPDRYRRPPPPPPRYRAGRRYDHAPRGWHRFDRRPGDWNRRGCIMVGPVWFCP